MSIDKNRVRTRHLRDILHIEAAVFEPDLAYIQLYTMYKVKYETAHVKPI